MGLGLGLGLGLGHLDIAPASDTEHAVAQQRHLGVCMRARVSWSSGEGVRVTVRVWARVWVRVRARVWVRARGRAKARVRVRVRPLQAQHLLP